MAERPVPSEMVEQDCIGPRGVYNWAVEFNNERSERALVSIFDLKTLKKRKVLSSADAQARSYVIKLAHVKSFHAAQDPTRDVIFLLKHSFLDGVNPIMGGIPVVFPNFGSAKGLPGHGFARVTNWTLAGVEEAADAASSTVATFTMAASDKTRKMWPVDFELKYEVKLSANQLETALIVHNTHTEEIDFHALLHNYIYVDDVRDGKTKVAGLSGLEYFDKVAKVNKTQNAELSITAETDSIYYNAPSTLTVSSKGVNAADRTVVIEKSGFIGNGVAQTKQDTDAVIWNPWVERSKTLVRPDYWVRLHFQQDLPTEEEESSSEEDDEAVDVDSDDDNEGVSGTSSEEDAASTNLGAGVISNDSDADEGDTEADQPRAAQTIVV
ncbi:aldose 1-epimerase, putative [Phytophthora infestans T30-4]|uniref:Aldose 1-epimerase, putative n=1 Tax=Phytophthora infestans (strain T30-4) TaxID=403677 RepID=D0P0T4_PHYIT|nr:aldose 1-epimerase, putative [Phytophthora infestans T30-4]EEY53053.1 aldose 1-epimerase, putative [Phytophthora infestans T30-4]|eukprot:XP_002896078.1 aldose 1-epimerase, putative [Phytophthora infestans T30-4]